MISAALSGVAIVALSGCGGGSSDGGPATTKATTTTATTTTTTTTTTPCTPEEWPERPEHPWAFNGQALPKICLDKKQKVHFFGIGDWGGDSRLHTTWENPGKYEKRGCGKTEADTYAQQWVARQMKAQAAEIKKQGDTIDFIINAGDNFYPGGIEDHCGEDHWNNTMPTDQVKELYLDMYNPETDLHGAPWIGVLGNHDYGGRGFTAGWDSQIFYTWDSKVWRLPGAFWMQRIMFDGFDMEIFNLDSNTFDAPSDPDHNICQGDNCGKWGIDQGNCVDKLSKLLADGITMVRDRLKVHRANWTIVNTHFHEIGKSYNHLGQAELAELRDQGHIDLLFMGHTHRQNTMTCYGGIQCEWNYIISGGGGGVTSDDHPRSEGNDDAYGYTYLTVEADKLYWEMRGHGGRTGEVQIRKKCTLNKNTTGKLSKATCEDGAQAVEGQNDIEDQLI